jgi:hypothetical protein
LDEKSVFCFYPSVIFTNSFFTPPWRLPSFQITTISMALLSRTAVISELHKNCWRHFETFAQPFNLAEIQLTFTGQNF